jgi:hypothetical protein
MGCVRWKSYEPNVLACRHSHYLLANVRRTVIAEESTGKIFEMHRFAPSTELAAAPPVRNRRLPDPGVTNQDDLVRKHRHRECRYRSR